MIFMGIVFSFFFFGIFSISQIRTIFFSSFFFTRSIKDPDPHQADTDLHHRGKWIIEELPLLEIVKNKAMTFGHPVP